MKTAINFKFLTAILSIALMICTGCNKTGDPIDNNGDDPNNPNNQGDTTAVYQDILDYVNLVMAIENMKQTSFIDQEANGARFFSLKADNSTPSGSYIAYEITNYANDVYLIHIRLWIGYIV